MCIENEKRTVSVFFLYVPINPYNAKAVFIELKEMTLRARYVYFINRK